jgi:hypothetical protein
VEPADELIELLQRAGLRQAEMTDVVVDLHLVVIDPERMVDVPWHLHQLSSATPETGAGGRRIWAL